MRIDRVWNMPNRWTFSIKPIKKLLNEEIHKGLWIDPMAGKYSPAEITNDLDPEKDTTFHLDAIDFVKTFSDNSVDGILYDPPYSLTQAVECYKGIGKEYLKGVYDPYSMGYWARLKNECSRVIKPGGRCISFGWNSMGLGKNRGFEMYRILLVAHGGSQNDTIVTIEYKIQTTL